MSDPVIDIRLGNYISRIWMLSSPKASFNVLMVLHRELPDGEWVLKYRFRYFRDDKAHGSEDEKSIWRATFPKDVDEAEAIRKVSPVIQKLKAMTRMEVDVTVVGSDEPRLVLHLMAQKPYFHMKTMEGPSS